MTFSPAPPRWLTPLGWPLLAALLLMARPTAAQHEPPKYGKIDLKEFDAATFARDTGAAAVVLADVGRAYFVHQNGGFRLMFERTRRVKILDTRGFAYATARIPLYRENSVEERVLSLKAATYRLVSGKVEKTELKSADVVTEQLDAHHLERRFTMPAVQAGAVVEYAYTVQSDFIFNLQDWWFQEGIPVRHSEYRVQIPEFLEYTHRLTGYAPLRIDTREVGTTVMSFRSENNSADIINSGGVAANRPASTNVPVQNYRWVGIDMPAFRSESYITTPADYLTHIRFQLSGTRMPGQTYRDITGNWGSVNRLLLASDDFGGYLGVTGTLTPALQSLRTSQIDLVKRAAAVTELVRSRVAFDGNDRLYATQSARKVLELQRGNAAEINLLLVSALREAGLSANPALVSTRQHGRIYDDLPLLDRFNFVLAVVELPGQSELLLDATDPATPAGQVPARCLNTRGRVIAPTEAHQRWVAVLTPHPYTQYTAGTLALRAGGGGTGALRREFGGYAAQEARQALQATGAASFAAAHAHLGADARLVSHQLSEQQNPAKPLVLALNVEVTGEGEADAATQYFSLSQLLQPAPNPLTTPERHLPIDLGTAFNETIRLTLTLPDGYVAEALPTPVNMKLPDDAGSFQFVYSAGADGRTVDVMSRFVLRKASYSPEEYPDLRALYEQVLAKHAELVTLKRKS